MREIPISELVSEGTTQARHYDEDLVKRYSEAMKDGAVFPAVVAFSNGNGLYLADGFHRRGAALQAGRNTIEVDVRKPFDKESPQRSAILYAVGANDEHGQNRTPADKRHAVEMLLRDPEWSKWTDREIARQCRVSPTFVGTQRTRLINAGTLKKQPKRTRTDKHGKESKINTAKIGKSQKTTKERKKAPAQESGWTKADETAAAAILDALSELGKVWETATRAAQIHCGEVLQKTLREMV